MKNVKGVEHSESKTFIENGANVICYENVIMTTSIVIIK